MTASACRPSPSRARNPRRAHDQIAIERGSQGSQNRKHRPCTCKESIAFAEPILSVLKGLGRSVGLASRVGNKDRAEKHPALTVEAHHLELLVDPVIGRRGVK